MPSDADQHQLEDEILHLIGQVVTAWAELDDSLIHLLAKLAGCQPKAAGIIYYALDAFSTRLAVIEGLARHKLKTGKRRTALLQFIERLKKLATARNDIVHAVYNVVYKPKAKGPILIKKVFRSAREQLFQETVAQTGELETHVRLLGGAKQWLFLSGWTSSRARRARQFTPTGGDAVIS
jgi:hypothetical protein